MLNKILLRVWFVLSCVLMVSFFGCSKNNSDSTDGKKNSDADTASVQAEETIIITYGSTYKPFSWLGDDGVAYGVQKDFVEEILGKRMGLKVIHKAYPWARCQEMVKSGEVDGFFTVPTPERAEYTITSSIPFYETHFVMHTGKTNPKIEKLKKVKSISDLEKMADVKHIFMLGSGWHKDSLKNMKNIHEIPDATKIPLMLKSLRADVYIEQSEMFKYQAKEAGIADDILTFKEPSIRKMGWHIFIGKKSKYQSLMPKINDTLEQLQATGELEKIKLEIFKKNGIE